MYIPISSSLSSFNCFEEICTVDLISRLHSISGIAPVSFPDHSVIVWKLDLKAYSGSSVHTDESESASGSYDNLMFLKFLGILSCPDLLYEVNVAIAACVRSVMLTWFTVAGVILSGIKCIQKFHIKP